MTEIYAQRIEELRSMMRARDWDAVILTGSDPHHSEYPAERWKQVRWLTGFTGEAGDVVVTLDHAGLWTDTRYFIQANRQLAGTGVELHKTRVPEQVLIPEWLDATFPDSAVIAVDGLCQTDSDIAALPERFDIASVPDLLDAIWKDRPGIPQTPLFRVDPGEDVPSKLRWLREVIAEQGCDGILLTSLDEVAWMLNVRASDIEYNPLVISALLVTQDHAEWFVLKEEDEISAAVLSEIESEGVTLRRYDGIELALSEFQGRLMADSGTLNYHWRRQISAELHYCESPVQMRKAVKNETEVEGMRFAHLLDGIAVEQYIYWLEKSLQEGRRISEWDAALELGRLRAEADEYLGDSFETISAYGEGAALPHYITPNAGAPILEPHGLYLCDSGGQYTCGTTDITRTIPLGPCSEIEREDYTLVLKAHIDAAMAVFPAGTSGSLIDSLCREPLWRSGRNFGHGTGHGVGYVLCVHEGPHDMRQNYNSHPLLPGMVITDEPGLYREGMHGVRHENVLLVREAFETEFGRFFCFEPLTLCHFDTSILVKELLTDEELSYLNGYNELVLRELSPYLSEELCSWLREKTRPV